MNVLICGPKASNISGISDAISPRYMRKNPRSMYARVPHMMAQFVLKIEKLSHIIGTTPILEIARAYGHRPRLWFLLRLEHFKAIVINNVLEHSELILGAFPLQTRASSSRGSRYLIDLKSKCCGDNGIWWNNIENCDALGGKEPEVVFVLRYS